MQSNIGSRIDSREQILFFLHIQDKKSKIKIEEESGKIISGYYNVINRPWPNMLIYNLRRVFHIIQKQQ